MGTPSLVEVLAVGLEGSSSEANVNTLPSDFREVGSSPEVAAHPVK